jgi:hypothetical protein
VPLLGNNRRVVEFCRTLFYGEVVKRVIACILFAFLGLAMSVPAFAHAARQTKAQKDAQKSYKKYSKQYNKQQKKQLKAQQKANKEFNKNHPTISTTGSM